MDLLTQDPLSAQPKESFEAGRVPDQKAPELYRWVLPRDLLNRLASLQRRPRSWMMDSELTPHPLGISSSCPKTDRPRADK